MKAILIVLFALLACVVVFASCEHTIKTKLASKDALVLESTNSNEDSIEFMFKSAEHFPMIGVKLVRQVPTSTNSSSSQQSSQSGSQSQQSGSQSSSQTTQPQPQSSSGTGQMQQEQANATVSTSQQQQQQQSNSSSQASQQSSQSSNQTQVVEKQDNPSAQSSSQAGSQGTSSTSQATTPQSSGQNSTASSSSTSQSSQQGSSSSSQSTAQTSPVSQDNSSISGDTNMNLTPNTTQSSGQGSSSSGSEPASNSTAINNNTTLINETLQNIGVSNSTSKDVNITDVIGRIISGENITEIINSTLANLTQWLNSSMNDDDNNQSSQQQSKRGSLRRRLLSLLESNEESEDYAQYLKFNKLKLLSSEGETVKEIPLSDANIHWNYGHSVVVSNDQAFKVPHVDVELPLSSTSNRPTLKIRTMMTEAPSHIERNGRDIQLNPRSMDIQITLNNLHDLLSEQEKKLSGAKWSIETEMTSTANSLHLMQTKNLNSVQRVVVMGNNFSPKGQFTFNSSPNMKIIQNADNDDLISIQIQDSSNSIQLNPIKFGVQ